MSDIVSGVRQVIQDMVAPDLKAQGAKLDGLQKQIEMLQKHMDAQHDVVTKNRALQYEAIMKTVDGLRAEMRSGFSMIETNQQLEVLRQMGPLSERVAVPEANIKRA